MITLNIKGCKDCPFAILDTYSNQMVCDAIDRLGIDWVDKEGFDEMYEAEVIPTACPIKKGLLLI
jgi:hypothetical protein